MLLAIATKFQITMKFILNLAFQQKIKRYIVYDVLFSSSQNKGTFLLSFFFFVKDFFFLIVIQRSIVSLSTRPASFYAQSFQTQIYCMSNK